MIAYAITDPSTLNFHTLSQDLQRFATKANWILYRDKHAVDYAHKAQHFIQEARNHPFDKILLHGDSTRAYHLQADGVHLTSTQFDQIVQAKQLGLFVIISTHSEAEITQAQTLGADRVTFSPIFETPNKGKPKGVERLHEMASKFTIPIIALGGIVTKQHIALSQAHGAQGFASVRYFA